MAQTAEQRRAAAVKGKQFAIAQEARAKAAYQLLKDNGYKVKPNYNDYKPRNASLIRRANKLITTTDNYTTKSGPIIVNNRIITRNVHYTPDNSGEPIQAALTDADSMTKLLRTNETRGQIMLNITYIKSNRTITDWFYGELRNVAELKQGFYTTFLKYGDIEVISVNKVTVRLARYDK